MRKRILSLLAVMLVFAFVVVSCQRTEQEQTAPEGGDNAAVQETPVEETVKDVADKTKDIFAKVKDYTYDKKADFIAWVKGKSEKYDKEIAEIGKK